MAFATLALSELALVYGMRSYSTPAWRLPRNRWLDASVVVSVVAVVGVVFLPVAHAAFATTTLDARAVAIVIALALLPLVGIELLKLLFRTRHASPASVPQAVEAEADARSRSRLRS